MTEEREPTPIEEVAAGIMGDVLRYYERNVRGRLAALDASDDEREVRKRVDRMRAWAIFCWKEKNPEIRERKRIEVFGPDDRELRIQRGDGGPIVRCPIGCNGDGMNYSRVAAPRQHNHYQRTAPGFIVCDCEAGRMRNEAIRKHGVPEEKKRRGNNRKDF